ncbi:MAG: hypothetical protein KAY37_12575 [Phycisphaerae bacterium]|nr:hypothetical protein [Phycisphaerae bacterium]
MPGWVESLPLECCAPVTAHRREWHEGNAHRLIGAFVVLEGSTAPRKLQGDTSDTIGLRNETG